MTKKSKVVLFTAGGIAGLLILLFLVRSILLAPYTRNIPQIPDSQSISESVRDQILDAISNAKRRPSAENLGNIGLAYHSSANYAQAAECYKLAIERDESTWIWNYYLGYLYMEMGESRGVTEYFNRVINSNPEVHLAWYYCGEEYRNLRQYDQAVQYFNTIRNIEKSKLAEKKVNRADYFPLGTYARFQLARIYLENESFDLAEEILMGILQASPTFGPAYRLLGNLHRMKGDLPLSEQFGVRANDLMVYSPPVDTLVDRLALLSKSELYLLKKIDEAVSSGHSEWAFRLVKNGMESIPDNQDLISKAIQISLWMNNEEDATKYMNQHISYFKDDFNEMQSVGTIFFQKELYPQSQLYFARALEAKPGEIEIQEKLAVCLWNVGERQQALDLLSGIIESHPDDLDLLAEVTEIMFFELKQNQRALQYLILLDHFIPSNPKVQKMSAWMAESSGKIDEAVSLYASSFNGDPEDLTTIMNLGTLLSGQRLWDKAIKHYRQALVFHPNEPYFLEKLGTLLVNCPDPNFRNIAEGKAYSERAYIHVESQPITTISAGRSLAIAFAALGEQQNARIVLNQTIDLARRENFSQANMAVLENLSDQLTKQQ